MRRLRSRRARRPGAFTLLEVILASAIGALVMIGALGVLMTLQRSDRLAGAKFERVTETERLHKVLGRAFSNLLMSTRPTRETRGGEGEGAAPVGPPPPARLVLGVDPRLSGVVLRRRETGQGGPGAGAAPRVEMVLSRSPVPVRSRAQDLAYAKMREDEESMFADNDGEGGAMSKLSQSRGGVSQAFRGVLELRPSVDRRESGGTSEREPTYGLWWRPLPSLGDDGTPVGGEPAPPVELMDRLVYFQVQMFDDSRMKDELSATWERELPGYVQVELETVEGVWRKWMFEVDWNNGSEARGATGAEEEQAGGGADGGEAGAGGTPRRPTSGGNP